MHRPAEMGGVMVAGSRMVLSLSLSLSHTADLGDGLVEICVCGSCMGRFEFVFVI